MRLTLETNHGDIIWTDPNIIRNDFYNTIISADILAQMRKAIIEYHEKMNKPP